MGKIESREAIGNQGGGKQCQERCRNDQHEGVDEELRVGEACASLPSVGVVFKMPDLRQK